MGPSSLRLHLRRMPPSGTLRSTSLIAGTVDSAYQRPFDFFRTLPTLPLALAALLRQGRGCARRREISFDAESFAESRTPRGTALARMPAPAQVAGGGPKGSRTPYLLAASHRRACCTAACFLVLAGHARYGRPKGRKEHAWSDIYWAIKGQTSAAVSPAEAHTSPVCSVGDSARLTRRALTGSTCSRNPRGHEPHEAATSFHQASQQAT